MSGEGFKPTKMEERIRDAGPEGIAKSVFKRAFQNDHWQRENHLETLIGGGRVLSKNIKTKGRPAQILSHADFGDTFESVTKDAA